MSCRFFSKKVARDSLIEIKNKMNETLAANILTSVTAHVYTWVMSDMENAINLVEFLTKNGFSNISTDPKIEKDNVESFQTTPTPVTVTATGTAVSGAVVHVPCTTYYYGSCYDRPHGACDNYFINTLYNGAYKNPAENLSAKYYECYWYTNAGGGDGHCERLSPTCTQNT